MEKTNSKLKTKVLNRAVSITALLLVAALLFTGCPQKVKEEPKPDKTPPKEVTELQAGAGDSKVNLSWTNPSDGDLYQVEITASPAAGTLANPVYLAAEKSKAMSFIVTGLASDTEYTLTVKTIDKALNKSAGVSKTVWTQTAPVPGAPMEITLSKTPTTPTNGNVTISFTSSTSVNTAKWAKGVKTVDEVLASGTPITGNSFEVIENAKYSVGVQDNEGRREVQIIEITNIDKEPPDAPSGFTAVYDFGQKKIRLSWTDPADTGSGLKELRLTYTINGTDETVETIAKGVQTFELTNVQVQSQPALYAFSLKAIDNAGNESTAASVNITPSAQAKVTGISLNRTHLDTLMSNRDIEVTVSGSNFDKLPSLLVQVTDGSTNYPPVTAAIDAPNNKATAIVQAPVPSSPTDQGTTYTVKAIVNSITPAEATASFIVSKPARVTKITLTPNQLPFGSAEKVSVEVTGKNFDIRGETKIKLLDSTGNEVAGSTVTVPADVGNATSFTAELPLPNADGIYTAAVYFNEVKEAVTTSLHLYGAPEITSVTIPKAGPSYGGNKLPVRITGKNFRAPSISAASFSGTPALSDVQILSDTLVMANVYCPYAAGETDLTVTCTPEGGSPVQKTGKIIVKDYSDYTVGKIVLKDGSLVDKDDYTAIDESNPPVAVLIGAQNIYGAALGIALHISMSGLSWANYGSTGYNTKFEGIICTPQGGNASTATFTGDIDGSDNWEYICSRDPKGTKDIVVAENYPAFYWVNRYNTTYLPGADIKWYMPSVQELCQVYKKKDVINASLAKICNIDNNYADASLGTDSFWSSSQNSNFNQGAWAVFFKIGDVSSLITGKYYNKRVCCLAGF